MTLPNFELAVAAKTYSPRKDWTMKCTTGNQTVAGEARGYSYSDKDVNDSFVKRCYNKLCKANAVDLDRYNGFVTAAMTLDNGNHVVVIFLDQ